jgi:hypothetical protein
MSRTRVFTYAIVVVTLLIAAAFIAYSMGDLGERQSDPSGYGVTPTEPSTPTDAD